MPDLVKVGLNYPDPEKPGEERRAEAGDVVSDLPASSRVWLLEQGLIEEQAAEDVAPARKKGGR